MDLETLVSILKKAWSRKTCYLPDQEKWSPDNPAFGQCAITALIIQDFFGGEILYCKHYHHYWNKLPDGRIVDLTKEQFGENANPCPDFIVSRKDILESEGAKKAKTLTRYLMLKRRVTRYLILNRKINKELKEDDGYG
ncbi:YunG family protein [Rosettibacter firmus]|uniref:YunG family protein n=1 Tax=Rosettibacter firmus TaxID=3111522 RepID=UPI00336C0AA2